MPQSLPYQCSSHETCQERGKIVFFVPVIVVGLDGVFVTGALAKDSVKMSMRLPVLFRAVIFKLKKP